MSLINNMLKDLEKRKEPVSYTPYIALATDNNHPKNIFTKKNISMILIATTGVLFLLLSSILVKYFIQRHTGAPVFVTEVKNKTDVPTDPLTNAKDVAWLTPVTINGITLQVKENVTELSFLLNHAALYHLDSDNMSNQITLTIEHSQLQSELPPAAYLNTAIQHLSSETIDGNTIFTLTLNPDAFIKYVNLNSEDKNPELVIAIEYQSQANQSKQKNYASSSTVKAPIMQSLLVQQYQAALKAAEAGDYQLAINDLDALLKADPTYKDARVSLVALMLDQGDATKANQLVDKGLQLSPDYSPFVELKARLLSQEGKVKPAIALLQSASPALRDNPEYHALMAALYARDNNDQLAAQLYRQLLEIDMHNSSWWFGLGVSLDKLNYRQAAIDAYSKAVSEGHLNSDALSYLQGRVQALQEGGNAKA